MTIRTYNITLDSYELVQIMAERFEVEDNHIRFYRGDSIVASILKWQVKEIVLYPLLSEPVCVYEDGQGASEGSLIRSDTP
jgi:hypothetical protein